MGRLIDADELIKHERSISGREYDKASKGLNTYAVWAVASSDILAAPTVDAKPVRHGHWVRKGLLFHCSACSYGAFKSDFVYGARYCPICGARMDERTEE